MADEEEEGVVGDELGGYYEAMIHLDGSGGGGGLGALLVDLHEGLVDHLGQHQVVGRGHAYRRGGGVEGVWSSLAHLIRGLWECFTTAGAERVYHSRLGVQQPGQWQPFIEYFVFFLQISNVVKCVYCRVYCQANWKFTFF